MSALTARSLLALWVCKLTKAALLAAGRGGTTLPGRIALALCPALPAALAENVHITVVSGTNGKTTTCRMIETASERAGLSSFSNHSGANLLTGITTELADNVSYLGRVRRSHAVIECDELTAQRAYPLLQPDVIVLTNLYRDQLDRCGEITHVQTALRTAMEQTPRSELCLNGDDPLLCAMAEGLENPVHWFSAGGNFPAEESEGANDARYCAHCGAPYAYTRRTFAHLGEWYCPDCGAAHPTPELMAELLEEGEESSRLHLCSGGESAELTLPLPGGFHVYNAAAAAAALGCMGLPLGDIAEALEQCSAAFGRGESFALGGGVQMMLIKNPAGCDRALHHLSAYAKPFRLVLLLNDEAADGTDISWIWDADFEHLCSLEALESVTVAGRRAEELMIRLKYAGFPTERIALTHSEEQLVEEAAASALPTVILPTYTAMMALRPRMVKAAGGKEFWEQ